MVEKIICDYFGNLFAFNRAPNKVIEMALRGVEHKIDKATNLLLDEEFIEEEVTRVNRSIIPSKASWMDDLSALFFQKILGHRQSRCTQCLSEDS